MTPSFAQTLPSAWRRAGSSVALVASLAFTFQPSLLLAQVQMSDPDRVQTKPKAPPPPAKKASRTTATDNVSDDLNRREAERAASVVRSLSAPAVIAPTVKEAAVTPVDSLPPTVATIPPRVPIAKAALTPGVDLGQPDLVSPPSAAAPPTIVEQQQPAAPLPKFAQAPTPAPVPISHRPPERRASGRHRRCAGPAVSARARSCRPSRRR